MPVAYLLRPENRVYRAYVPQRKTRANRDMTAPMRNTSETPVKRRKTYINGTMSREKITIAGRTPCLPRWMTGMAALQRRRSEESGKSDQVSVPEIALSQI